MAIPGSRLQPRLGAHIGLQSAPDRVARRVTVAMGRPDIVRSAADVTPEWMTAVLTEVGALVGGRVTMVTPTAIGTGQMADTTRLALTFDRADAGPPSVVGKFASSDEQSRATGLALRAY